jgi:hypothetical protein
VVIKGSLYFNFMQQEKVPAREGDEDERKWTEATPQDLLAAYSQYYTEVESRENEERKN